MLYVPAEINGIRISAFVETGAQTTLISTTCAERCDLLRLIDKRFAGSARGIGSMKTLGRIHTGEIKIGDCSLTSSFTVMDLPDTDLILGLDLLMRHRACIDLDKHVLRIGQNEIHFLSEGELAKNNFGRK